MIIILLTHFSPMFQFYTPRKRQKTFRFPKFSRGRTFLELQRRIYDPTKDLLFAKSTSKNRHLFSVVSPLALKLKEMIIIATFIAKAKVIVTLIVTNNTYCKLGQV